MAPTDSAHATWRQRSEPLQQFPISHNQGFFFGASPTFELALAFQCCVACGVVFGAGERHGSSAPGERRRLPSIVLRKPQVDVTGFANVERIVCTTKNVNTPHRQTTMPSSIESFNSATCMKWQSRRTAWSWERRSKAGNWEPFDSLARSGHSPRQVTRHERTFRFAEGEPEGESNGGGGSRTRTWRDRELIDGARLLDLTRSFDGSCRRSSTSPTSSRDT